MATGNVELSSYISDIRSDFIMYGFFGVRTRMYICVWVGVSGYPENRSLTALDIKVDLDKIVFENY